MIDGGVTGGQERLSDAPDCEVDVCLRGFAQSGFSHGHVTTEFAEGEDVQ